MNILGLILTVVTIGCAHAACPAEWMPNASGSKCFLVAPFVRLGSLWDEQEFCTNIGGKVVEPMTVDELNEVKAIGKNKYPGGQMHPCYVLNFVAAANGGKWTDGPWINYLTLTGNRVLSATALKAPADAGLNKALMDVYDATNGGNQSKRCFGFDQDGVTFNIDDCVVNANPFCEMPMGGMGKPYSSST